jgi:hypothetical protein
MTIGPPVEYRQGTITGCQVAPRTQPPQASTIGRASKTRTFMVATPARLILQMFP